jgi:urate oxidase
LKPRKSPPFCHPQPLNLPSYTQADNSVIVATDTQKQATYILAKQHPITPIESFASILASHFVTTYPHIHGAHVKIIQHRWARMPVKGVPHKHSFLRDGAEIRTAEVHAQEGKGIRVKAGLDKLLVLKSTGSAFYGFHRDEFTRLPETWDRILSTEVKADWTYKAFGGLEEVVAYSDGFDRAHERARTITMETFAEDESASVQNTMFKMCEQILGEVGEVEKVDYSLPNKHYFEIGKFYLRGWRVVLMGDRFELV